MLPSFAFLESDTARNHAKGKGYDSLAWRATQGKALDLEDQSPQGKEYAASRHRPLVDRNTASSCIPVPLLEHPSLDAALPSDIAIRNRHANLPKAGQAQKYGNLAS